MIRWHCKQIVRHQDIQRQVRLDALGKQARKSKTCKLQTAKHILQKYNELMIKKATYNTLKSNSLQITLRNK
jgi:hypothetical protein